MAKKRNQYKERIIGINRGDLCSECGGVVDRIVRAMPPYGWYAWLIFHIYSQETCAHVDKDMPPELNLLAMNNNQ